MQIEVVIDIEETLLSVNCCFSVRRQYKKNAKGILEEHCEGH